MASTATSTDRQISGPQFCALVQEVQNDKTKIGSINEGISDRVKQAVDNRHLHRAAFNLARKLYKMDELKRQDFIRSAMLYIEFCSEGGLFGSVAQHVGDLVDEAEGKPKRGRPKKDDGGTGGSGGALGDVAHQLHQKKGEATSLSEAAKKVAAGIKQLKPKAPKKNAEGEPIQ